MSLKRKQHFFYALFFAELLGIVGFWFANNQQSLARGGEMLLILVGGLCGLLAGFFFLYQLIFISGARFIEKFFGLDRLARIHHVNGLVGYFFVIAHVLCMVAGYAAISNNGFFEQLFILRDNFDYVPLAFISLLLLDVVIITSIVIVRKRLKYEYWYFVHLCVYAAVLLALFHQISNGRNLLSNDLFKTYWLGLYALAFGLVLWRRWLLPLWLHFRHGFIVERVETEAKDVTSIYISGKRLNGFTYEAGQFNLWYFWQKGVRAMHHPFTISSAPGEPFLRVSAKAIGDYTSQLKQLKPGTRVLISGPYGLFTQRVATAKKRLFIAGGIGITPIRSMLQDKVKKGDVLVYAAQTKADLAFSQEFEELKARGLKVVYVLSDDKQPKAHSGYITKEILYDEVPALTKRDIWLCGPPPMMRAVKTALSELGVSKHMIHTEEFRL